MIMNLLKKKNKRGWIEIIEAFVAVLLIAGVVLIILSKGYFKGEDISNKVYYAELSILREIQNDDQLRTEIAGASSSDPQKSLPIEWDDSGFPVNVKNKITSRTPDYLECVGKICDISDTCGFEGETDKDIYSQSISISGTLGGLVYRKLNLFCWTT